MVVWIATSRSGKRHFLQLVYTFGVYNLVTNLSNFASVARAHALKPWPFSNSSSKIILPLSQPQCGQNRPTRTQDIHTYIQSLMLQPSLSHSENSRVQNTLCGARHCVHDVLEHGHLCFDLGTTRLKTRARVIRGLDF